MTNTPSPAVAAAMTVSDALDVLHELACFNQLEDIEIAGDIVLSSLARWQQDALDTLGGLLFEHAKTIDTALALPSLAVCAPVPDRLCRPERDIDPAIPSNAVRICLELGQEAALEAEECGADPELLAGRVRQQRAFAITRAFLSLHAEAFDAAFVTPTGSGGGGEAVQVEADRTAVPVPLHGGVSRARVVN